MKKQKLSTWKTAGKKFKVRVDNKTVELSKDRNLFMRMIFVYKSRLNIDISKKLRVPMSFSWYQGERLQTMEHYFAAPAKSTLTDILKKLPVDVHEHSDTGVNQNGQHTEVQIKVSVVEAMAEVQCLDKPKWIKKMFTFRRSLH